MAVDAFGHLTAKADGGVEICSRPVLQQPVRRDDFVSDKVARAGNVRVIGTASVGSVCCPPLILHHGIDTTANQHGEVEGGQCLNRQRHRSRL